MVFNFYFNNNEKEDKSNKDLENIMKNLENHFANWHDFYQFYSKHAPVPDKFKEQIQQFYEDLREEFVSIIREYNKKINYFADIHEESDTNSQFEKDVVKQMKEMMSKSKKDDDSNFNMYN
tara:strand:+ start:224 stop:586 length:363 start_codon:yes stop_codon:yes gene_type:complete